MDRETRSGIRLGLRLALAHHPLCSYFDADVLGRRVRLCQGCLLTWPLFALGLPLMIAALRQGVPWEALLAAGVLGGLPQVVAVLWRGPRWFRAGAKAVGGPALAALLSGILWWPLHGGLKLVVLAAVLVGLGAMLYRRMRSILATCDACPWRRDWGACPGFPVATSPPGSGPRSGARRKLLDAVAGSTR